MIHSAQRILIVEDNKTDARLIRDLLERYGYETLQTGDGFEAMKLALACLPHLILMDIQLPEISGLEVTRRLKGDERSRNIPIIAVTAFAMGWHEREALDSGCDGFSISPQRFAFAQSPANVSMVVRLYAFHERPPALNAVLKLCQEHGIPGHDQSAVV